MGKLHVKRLSAPNTWPIEKKSTAWVTRPKPGSQPMNRTLSVNTILREILKLAKTSREAKLILSKGLIKIDGKIRKDPKYPVCVLDSITIKEDSYRLLINQNNKLFLHKITKEDSTIKPRKIIGRRILKGNKIQINFLDGKNMLSKDNKLKVSDTVVYENEKEKEHISLQNGVMVYLLDGKQVGRIGTIKEIKVEKNLQKSKLVLQSDKEEFTTLKDYAIVIGKTKPVIDIPK